MKHILFLLLFIPLALFGQRDTVITSDLGYVVDTTNLIISGGDTTVRVVYLNKNSTQQEEILYYEQSPSSKATLAAIYNDLLLRIPIASANSEAAYLEFQRRNTELINLRREFLAIEEVMSTYYGYSGGALPEPEPPSSSGTVPAGGTTGQILAKIDGTDYNTEWVDPSSGVPDLTTNQVAFGDGDGKMRSSSSFVVDTRDGLRVKIGTDIYDSTATLNAQKIATDILYVNQDIQVNNSKYGFGEMYLYNIPLGEPQFKVSAPDELTVVEYGRIDGSGDGNRYKFNGSNSTSYVTNAATEHKFGINTDNPSRALDVVGDIFVGHSGFGTNSFSKFATNYDLGSGAATLMGDISGNLNGDIIGISATESGIAYYNNLDNTGKFGINTNAPTVALDVVGDIKTSSTVILQGFTVSTLPTGVIGMIAYVTDADSPTYLSTVVGGGSTVCKVFFDGSNWICN